MASQSYGWVALPVGVVEVSLVVAVVPDSARRRGGGNPMQVTAGLVVCVNEGKVRLSDRPEMSHLIFLPSGI